MFKWTKYVFVVLLLWPALAMAATRYVDGSLGADCTSGNYSIASRNCSGSDGNAWNTIAEGLLNTSAGDILYLRAGTYTVKIDSNVTQYPAGTSWSDAPLISNYASEVVTVRPPSSGPVLNFSTSTGVSNPLRYMHWRGLILDGINGSSPGHDCIGTGGTPKPDHIRIEGMEIKNCRGNGILGGGPFWEVLNNHIHDTTAPCPSQPCSHGIYWSGTDSLIEGNIVHGFNQYGAQNFVTGGGVHRNVWRNNIFYSNNVAPNVSGGGLFIGAGNDNQAYNNVMYNNGETGIFVDSSNPERTLIYNNTVYGHNSGIFIGGSATPVDTVVRNNIAYNNSSNIVLFAGTNTVFSHNLCNTTNSRCTLAGNPNFTDPGNGDFTLQSGSPAINSGATLALVSTDILGITRPQGAAYDIGAYEFTTMTPNTYTVTRNLSTVPAGQSIVASWEVDPGPGQALDWIALVAAGDVPENYIPFDGVGQQAWVYTNGELQGVLSIAAPLTAGNYEFIYCLNGLYNCPGRSAAFTVTTPPTAEGFVVAVSRWHKANVAEATSATDPDWIEGENASIRVNRGQTIRFRTQVQCRECPTQAEFFALYCSLDGVNWTRLATNWDDFDLAIGEDSVKASGDATTARLTIPAGYTPVSGFFVIDPIDTDDTVTLLDLELVEYEYSIAINPAAILGDNIRCQARHNNGTALDAYLMQNSLTIGEESTTFSSGTITSGTIK